MLCHLTTEKTVLRATSSFRLTRKTRQFYNTRFNSKLSFETRKTIFRNWFDTLNESASVRDLGKTPPLCTPYGTVPSTSSQVTLQGPEHAESSTNQERAETIKLLIQDFPGRYLALDCEMVGVGSNASESSVARVSIVNYDGIVVLDEYVKQRAPVVDYRTPWSGIRASDMIMAQPFEEVQKKVNDLLEGRILIGHAIHNDLKVLLLSHPTEHTRDTQSYAYKFALSATPRISLKRLVKQQLGVDIQTGEHSSVQDAKATMAIYRLHRNVWERASGMISQIRTPEPSDVWDLDRELNITSKKRKIVRCFGIGIRTGEDSWVMDTKPRGIYRLQKNEWMLSQMRQLRTKGPWDLDGESTTIKRRKVDQQDVGIDIQTGGHSSAMDAKATGTSQIRKPKTKGLQDSVSEKRLTPIKSKVARQQELEGQIGEHVVSAEIAMERLRDTWKKTRRLFWQTREPKTNDMTGLLIPESIVRGPGNFTSISKTKGPPNSSSRKTDIVV